MNKIKFCSLILEKIDEIDGTQPCKEDYFKSDGSFKKESYASDVTIWWKTQSVLFDLLQRTVKEAYLIHEE